MNKDIKNTVIGGAAGTVLIGGIPAAVLAITGDFNVQALVDQYSILSNQVLIPFGGVFGACVGLGVGVITDCVNPDAPEADQS